MGLDPVATLLIRFIKGLLLYEGSVSKLPFLSLEEMLLTKITG
jgi:hypothetical protein